MSSEEINLVISVLNGILNPDNETRKLSVSKLDELRQNTPGLFYCIIKILESEGLNAPEYKMTKTVAAVLGRKLIQVKEDELLNENFVKMSKELKEEVKTALIKIFVNEQDVKLKAKICDLVIEAAVNVYENEDNWDELLEVLLKCLSLGSGADANQLESAMTVLAGIFGYAYESLIIHIDLFVNSFRAFFSQTDNLTLKTRTVRTISEMVLYCEKRDLKHFHEFMMPLLETTLKCLEASVHGQGTESLSAESNLKYCLRALTDISGSHPVLLKKHFGDVFTLMCKIADTKDFTDENIRDIGFEVIISMVERRNNLFLKDTDKLKYFLELLYKFALEMDKEVTDDWANPTTNDYVDEEFIYEEKVSSAFSFIDRLVEHLSVETMLPLLSEIILQLLQNDKDWRFKYIALLSISEVMHHIDDIAAIENIFPTVFTHASDPSPKVRYASVNCINEMSDSLQPNFQINYHDKAVPVLLDRLHNEPILRVQLETVEALISFTTHQTDSQCMQYIEPLLETLFGLFIKEIPINLRGEVLEAVCEIVVTTGKLFTPYAERSLKLLLDYFINVYHNKTVRPLYGNLIEAVTLIGDLNWEGYSHVVPDIAKIIIELTESLPLSTDPIRTFIQQAIGRLIPRLKKHFPELIPSVVHSVLKLVDSVPQMSVSSKPEETFKIEDLFAATSDQESNKESPEIQKQSVKTSETEDMANSIELLNTMIEALQEMFLPYIESTQKVILTLLKYFINEEVRKEASNTLPLIIGIIAEHSKEHLVAFGKNYISELISVIEKEFDNETLSVQLENLGDIVLKCGFILNKEELNILFSKILVLFDEVEKRRLNLLKKQENVAKTTGKKTPTEDEEEYDSDEELMEEIEKDIEEIENIQSDIADNIGFLFKTHKEISSDIVNKLLTEILPVYFRDNASHFEIRMGIFIADDMIEYLGQDYLQNIWNDLAHVVTKYCDNSDCTIRQAACYGLGVFAEHTKQNFGAYIDEFLLSLTKALSYLPEESNEDKWGLARDNAVTSLGKIIKHHGHVKGDNLVNLISQWLKYLPITYDIDESPEQHELLCDILMQKPELVLGENYSNLPALLRILARIFKTKYSVKEVNGKIEQIFVSIKGNPQMMSIALQTLEACEDGKIKTKLHKLLQ